LQEEMKIAALALLALMLSLPAASLYSNPPQKDVPAEMESAERALQNARNELEHAGTDWGGHRVAAIKHVDAALQEIQAAEKYAREHHEMK
jgi:hypothetical protein